MSDLVLSPGLKSHETRIREILDWMPDWISQHEFDLWVRAEPRKAYFVSDETYMLHWSYPDLDLLQMMIREDLAEYEKREDGLMYYRSRVLTPIS